MRDPKLYTSTRSSLVLCLKHSLRKVFCVPPTNDEIDELTKKLDR
jgi:hypothetical protein